MSTEQPRSVSSTETDSPFLPPLMAPERWYNAGSSLLLVFAACIIAILPLPICCDVFARTFLGFSLSGIAEMETLALVLIAFTAMPFVTASRTHIAIDIFFEHFSHATRQRLELFSCLLCACMLLFFSMHIFQAVPGNNAVTPSLLLPESFFVIITGGGLVLVAVGMLFQVLHILKERMSVRDFWVILVALAVTAFFYLPELYRASGLNLSKLGLGLAGFALLFALLLLRVPIGLAMCCIGIIGMLSLMRSEKAVWSLLSLVPYRETANFVLVAVPMFMFMGEITSVTGISRDMFDCAYKWLGRMPGGLACASVGGCAGFGAICGDSLPTVIAMSSVALPAMNATGYAPSLSCGALAAGGTLGILIPPSMGFVFYSIMTEESVGKLFVAGIVPGLVLTLIFMAIIVFMVWRDPSLAPPAPHFPLREKVRSLVGLIPMLGLFIVVIGGILAGLFTPGEGGGIGSFGAVLYALCRGQMSWRGFRQAVMNTAKITGRIFVILMGVYVFGVFLTSSRLPALLAQFVVGLEFNKYVILAIVIAIYILMGCVMNITPMMLLTLPSIYPTIQSCGFDGIWFGVITVIVMEMGMITPPVGMNVFTLASLAPNTTMLTIFKGVIPFVLGMALCILLIIIFPQIALWLPQTLL